MNFDKRQTKLLGITLLVGVLIGYIAIPKKKEIQIKEVVKIVEKEVEKKNKHTTINKKKDKDGNETTTIDITEDTTKTTDKQSESKTEIAKTEGKGVGVGLYAITEFKLKQPDYGVLVDIPVTSKLSVIASGDTAKRVALGLKLEF
jgi:hypothetical protein